MVMETKTERKRARGTSLRVVSLQFAPAPDAGRKLAKVYEILLTPKKDDEGCEDEQQRRRLRRLLDPDAESRGDI